LPQADIYAKWICIYSWFGRWNIFAVRLQIFAPSLEKFYSLVREKEFPNEGAKKEKFKTMHKYTE
jgi:hypothetical protein